MYGNTTVTARSDRHGDGDEFDRLCVESPILPGGAGQSLVAAHRVGRNGAELPDAGDELGAVSIPVQHDESPCLANRVWRCKEYPIDGDTIHAD